MVVVTSVRAARGAAALRVLAPAAPLRLPRRRPGAAAPALDRAAVPRLARPRPSTGGALWALAAGAGAGLAGRPARSWRNAAAPAAGRPRWSPRRTASCRSTSPAAACDRLPVEAGQFFTWRFLGRAGLDPRQPVLALRGARRPQPADHRQGRSATAAPRLPRLRPGTRVLVEGPYGRLSPRARDPAQGRADRRRASGSPRCGRWPRARLRARRRGPPPARSPTGRCSPRELDRAGPRARACSVLSLPGRRRAPTPGSATASAPADDLDRAAALGPRPRRARRLRLRPRRPGPSASAARSPPPACPPDHFHVETFGW